MKANGAFKMPFVRCLISAFFTALPGVLLIILLLLTDFLGSEPWWEMFLAVLVILSTVGLLSGFLLPALFQRMGFNRTWIWIMVQGALAWGVTLLMLGIFSLTPLCIGQENGDGVNDLANCMERAVMSGCVCTPFYVGILMGSAFTGNWVSKRFK